MPVVIIVGAQWGDEGKGKIVDMLAEKVQMVVRYSGGDNAGHTVINPQGEFKLHLIPSGIFYPHTTCVIGNGVVVNPASLLAEMDDLNQRSVETSRLWVSDRSHLIMPYHLLLDGLEETSRGSQAIGTTRKGIGPAYSDKAARLGIRTGELLDPPVFRERLAFLLELKNAILTRIYGLKPLSLEEVYQQYCRYGERMAPHIRDTPPMLEEALERGEWVLLEGAQGTLLDPDFGTYPYTTSSSPLAGGACLGAGLSPVRINHILGVFKAYCTRVGGGPMPTELKDKTADRIREKGHEYGATTGRPRRCGWFDAVAGRYSTRINGFTSAVVTRLDILEEFPSIRICVGYKAGDKTLDTFPASITTLSQCQPVYEELPGWQTPLGDIRDYNKLPPAARGYISRLEELVACPVSIVSVGSRREQTIVRTSIF
ncbi:MAG: adenylosuccinate synthase [Chloroflexota bacterium]